MSFSTLRYLYCDGPRCVGIANEPFDIDPNVDEPIARQRTDARSVGWVQRGGLDLCPSCVTKEADQ